MYSLPLFVTCSRGIEPLLVAELTTLGVSEAREARGGVAGKATLETAYRACLWSRLASRVLLPLKTFELGDAQAIYEAAQTIERTEEHTSELQSLMRTSYAVFCLKKKN